MKMKPVSRRWPGSKTLAVAAGLAGFVGLAAAALRADEVKYVSEIPPARHPQIVYWFWQKDTLDDGQYLRDVEHMAKDSPFTFAFLGDRGAGFYDFHRMHDPFAKTVASAHAKNLKVGLQLYEFWARGYDRENPARGKLNPSQALAFVTEGEVRLDASGHADYSVTTTGARTVRPFHSEVLKVYAIQKTRDGFYAPGSLAELSGPAVKTVKASAASVTLAIDAPAGLAGRTAYILVAHYHQSPDLFNDLTTDAFRDALEHYQDIPFDGFALDEFGYARLRAMTPGYNFRERFYGKSFAAEFARRTGQPLERALFDMRFAPDGRPEVRARAINQYFDVMRDGPLRVETACYHLARKYFGTNTFAGIHNTYHNHLDNNEVWRTGLNWWTIPRDYGQSDENLSLPLRLGLLVAFKQPVTYDQYYDGTLNTYLKKTFAEARFGGRTHYHAWNDTNRLNLAAAANLTALRSVEGKIRLLNQFDPAAPKLPLLVVFGMPAQLNWYPDSAHRSSADINNGLHIEEKANALWQAGFPCAVLPSDLIDNGQLTLDAENHPVINGHKFDALVYLYPQYAKPASLEFLERYVQRGGKLMLEGAAILDFSGNDIAARFKKLSAQATVCGFDVAKISQLGVATNTLPDGAYMEDGAVVLTDFNSWEKKLARPFRLKLAGHEFSGTYIGVCALKVDGGANLQKFACGNFRELRRDGRIICSLPSPADVFIARTTDNKITALVAGTNHLAMNFD